MPSTPRACPDGRGSARRHRVSLNCVVLRHSSSGAHRLLSVLSQVPPLILAFILQGSNLNPFQHTLSCHPPGTWSTSLALPSGGDSCHLSLPRELCDHRSYGHPRATPFRGVMQASQRGQCHRHLPVTSLTMSRGFVRNVPSSSLQGGQWHDVLSPRSPAPVGAGRRANLSKKPLSPSPVHPVRTRAAQEAGILFPWGR